MQIMKSSAERNGTHKDTIALFVEERCMPGYFSAARWIDGIEAAVIHAKMVSSTYQRDFSAR